MLQIRTINIPCDDKVTSAAIGRNSLVLGCPSFSSDRGCIFMYDINNDVWSDLITPPIQLGQYAGRSVACSRDDRFVVVGASWYNQGVTTDTGCIYIYDRTTNTWSGPHVPPTQAFQWAGFSVSCSSDGNIVIAGAPYYDQGGTINTGCIYIYDRTTNTWSGPHVPPTQAFQWAGFSIACSNDGNIVVIGAPHYNQDDTHDTGCIYIYDRTTNTWSGPHVPPVQAGQLAGNSVTCSRDGNIIVVGAELYDQGDTTDTGCIYIYDRTTNTWTGPLVPPTQEGQWAGNSVACSSDGSIVVVGTCSSYIHVYEVKTDTWLTIKAGTACSYSIAAIDEHNRIFAVSDKVPEMSKIGLPSTLL